MDTDSNTKISFKIIKGKDLLLNLKYDWDDLYSRAYNSHGFLSYPWLSSFLKKNEYSGIPIGFTMWDNKKLIAVLFLQIKNYLGIKYATPLGHGEAFFWGILHDFSDQSYYRLFSTAFFKYLKLNMLYIDDLYSKDKLTSQFIDELRKQKLKVKFQKRDVCLSINLKDSFEDFYNERKTKKQQKEIEKKISKVNKTCDAKIEKYRGIDIDLNILERLCKIQTKSWLIQRGIKTLRDDFIQTIIRSLIEYDYARAWILILNGEDAAFRLGFRSHEVYYSYWTAFDIKFKDLRPGLYLNRFILEDCCNEGIKDYEFMHGDGEHKRFWFNEENSIERVIIYRGLIGAIITIPYKVRWQLSKIVFLRVFINKLRMYRARFSIMKNN